MTPLPTDSVGRHNTEWLASNSVSRMPVVRLPTRLQNRCGSRGHLRKNRPSVSGLDPEAPDVSMFVFFSLFALNPCLRCLAVSPAFSASSRRDSFSNSTPSTQIHRWTCDYSRRARWALPPKPLTRLRSRSRGQCRRRRGRRLRFPRRSRSRVPPRRRACHPHLRVRPHRQFR